MKPKFKQSPLSSKGHYLVDSVEPTELSKELELWTLPKESKEEIVLKELGHE